jgi:exopolysaccharide biosynthesis polyprenyl glycosylphosphotransferase
VIFGGDKLQPSVLLVVPLIVIAAKVQGLYDHDDLVMVKSTVDELPRLFNLATLFALLVFLSRHYIVRGAPGTTELLALWLMLIAYLALFRHVARSFAARRSPTERCLLLGAGEIHRRLAAKMADCRHLELIGAVPLEHVRHPDLSLANRGGSTLHRLTHERRVHRIIIAPNDSVSDKEVVDIVRQAKSTGVRVSLLPNILGAVGGSVVFDDIRGMTLMGVPRLGLSHSSAVLKRAFDIVGAGVVLVAAAPLLAVAALGIKLGSPGPVLFHQTRVGRDGRRFRMFKLRTMVVDAEAMKVDLARFNEADGIFKIADDPRITRAGALLRHTHLDELPQLINVLRGEMSLVGPRPLVIDEDERVTGLDRHRLHLTPGMTGQWQILGAARVPLSEMVKLDYLYVANWSLWGDFKILLRTLPVVAQQRGL